MRDQFRQIYQAKGKIIILYILILRF